MESPPVRSGVLSGEGGDFTSSRDPIRRCPGSAAGSNQQSPRAGLLRSGTDRRSIGSNARDEPALFSEVQTPSRSARFDNVIPLRDSPGARGRPFSKPVPDARRHSLKRRPA